MTKVQKGLCESVLKPLVRDEWISACEFHPLNESEVLKEVFNRVSQLSHAIVLLDLDSTLYEVGPRTLKILQEWAKSSSVDPGTRTLEIKNSVLEMSEAHVGYSISDTFSALDFSLNETNVKGVLESAKRFWFERFFTNSYLPNDRPYRGAAEFTRQLHQLGAEIVYLTGRDEPNMGEGTRMNLIRDGFAWGVERTHLLMKSTFDREDLDHKAEAARSVGKYGTVVASFENEPPNVVALQKILPDAMHVFVDTVCSLTKALPCLGLYRISHFHSEVSGNGYQYPFV